MDRQPFFLHVKNIEIVNPIIEKRDDDKWMIKLNPNVYFYDFDSFGTRGTSHTEGVEAAATFTKYKVAEMYLDKLKGFYNNYGVPINRDDRMYYYKETGGRIVHKGHTDESLLKKVDSNPHFPGKEIINKWEEAKGMLIEDHKLGYLIITKFLDRPDWGKEIKVYLDSYKEECIIGQRIANVKASGGAILVRKATDEEIYLAQIA